MSEIEVGVEGAQNIYMCSLVLVRPYRWIRTALGMNGTITELPYAIPGDDREDLH